MSTKRKRPTDETLIEKQTFVDANVNPTDPVDLSGIDAKIDAENEKKRARLEADAKLHDILSQTRRIHSEVTGKPDTNGGKRRKSRRKSKKRKSTFKKSRAKRRTK
jgi:hypothetical protein